ncbi:MAG: glutathione peroxidase [Gammaproteobacteria bacterium]
MKSIYSFSAASNDGETVSLESFKGKVLLIVNTASRCGFTPQYRGLEEIYREYKDRGLEILAFPCNQFGAQEPGTNQEIAAFCETNYQISFPLFEKIDVNGDQTHPIYRFLKSEAPGVLGSKTIKWNFTKFLIDREGKVVKRYGSMTSPSAIIGDIERLLATSAGAPE